MDISQVNNNLSQQEDAIVEMLVSYYERIDKLEQIYDSVQTDIKEAANTDIEKICNLVNTIKKYNEIIVTLSDILSSLQEIVNASVQYINYSITQIILKRVQILSLRVKRIILEIKRTIANITKKMLEACNSGKGSIALTSIIGPIIAALQFVSQLVMYAIMGVNLLLKMVSIIMPVGAESMAFFMTFKSFKTTDIKAMNPNTSITDRLGTGVRESLKQLILAPDILNKTIIIASITAAAAAGAALIAEENSDFSKISCKALQLKDPASILKLIENLLTLLFIPQALPKYEKLLPINVGYLMWLILSFEPAGKKSFGFPGQP